MCAKSVDGGRHELYQHKPACLCMNQDGHATSANVIQTTWRLGFSHSYLVFSLQTVAAFIRPHPGQHLRGIWNHLHHTLGRLAIIVAWAAIWLGVAIGLADLPGSKARWVTPLAGRQDCGLPGQSSRAYYFGLQNAT
jgi:hypothetical protein